MIHTVRVTTRTEIDPLGADLLAEIHRTLGLEEVERVRTVKVYRLEGISEDDARRLASALLAEEIDQRWTLEPVIAENADRTIEVAYLPGVMNPEAESIKKAARDLGIKVLAVDSSREYAFYGRLSEQDLGRIVTRLLVNPTVEHVVEEPPTTLLIEGEAGRTETIPVREMSDADLEALSADGLYLDLDEMRAIQAHFVELGRDPTDLEMEVIAQTWSEHCVHKTFRSEVIVDGERKPPFMSRLKDVSRQYSELIVSAFVDNSGVMRFYDGWAIAGKVETHNSPSAIEPYGGAMTGSGGVFRDIMGTGRGAAVVASTDMFCFAPYDLPLGEVPPGALPPDYLLRRVVAGVRDYGNRMGIPTNNGSVHFHRDFRAKPTVIVGAYGIMPEELAPKSHPQEGDRIVVLGGRTGRDGIHGATFSSTAMTSETIVVNSQAVQIGNPIEEKRLLDAMLACRDAGLIHAITDCGAGGFSSAIGEMGEEMGATVELERAPLKYSGLSPWEIFVSESQERMVMAVAPDDLPAVFDICRRYNVEATDLGVFEPSGKLVVRYRSEVVGELEMKFLHDGRPERVLEARSRKRQTAGEHATVDPPADGAAWLRAAMAVLGHPDVASKEPIVRQYDHTVQGTAAMQPFSGSTRKGPSDAIVLTPLLGEPYGMVIAHGLNPVLNMLDPYLGSVWAAAEAMSNLVAVGGNPREASLIDNFIWPYPETESLADLDRAVDACVDVMHALERPFISGKDSLSSTYRYPDGTVLEIPPVLCVSVFGRIRDVARTVSSELKQAGSRLVLVGAVDADGMGGSVYYRSMGIEGGQPPAVDLDVLPRTLDAVHEAIRSGRVLACHDVSEGGLLTTIAEMSFGSGIGVAIELAGGNSAEGEAGGPEGGQQGDGSEPGSAESEARGDHDEARGGHGEQRGGASDAHHNEGRASASTAARPDLLLFNETTGVFVVELPEDEDPSRIFDGVPHRVIGQTVREPVVTITWAGSVLLSASLAELRSAWEAPMREVFH